MIAPHAVLFDWDNTLVDTWPVIHQAFHDLFVDYGRTPWNMEEVKEYVAKSMRDAFPELFGEQWEEAGKAYQAHYRKYNLERLKALEGAEVVLKWLVEAGVPVGVVSNKRNDNLRNEIAHLGWGEYFDAVVGSGDAPRDKPHADPILKALAELEMEDAEPFWYVGDSSIDLEASANVGAIPVLYGEVKVEQNPDGSGTYKGFAFAKHALTHNDLQQFLQEYVQSAA